MVITFRLQHPVVQPELRYHGFRPNSFYVPGNALAQDLMTLRSAMMTRIFLLFDGFTEIADMNQDFGLMMSGFIINANMKLLNA